MPLDKASNAEPEPSSYSSSAPAPIVTKRENNPGNLKVLLAEDFNFVKTQIKNLFLDF